MGLTNNMLPQDSCQAATRRGIFRNVLIALLLLLPWVPGYSATAPTVSSRAAANPNPVTGTTTTLSVLGTDDSGGTGLTYTWSATGPSPVAFSGNGTNTSHNTTATFQAAGSYVLQVLIKNSAGLTTTSGVSIAVNPTVTKVTVNPPSATVTSHANQQFTASIVDQFGNPIAQPNEPVGWTDLANTVLQNTCPPNNYGGETYNYYTLCPNVINAWSGAIADTLRNRMIIWGGGHQNYSGNEVFSLNLNANPPAFKLLTEPSFFNPNNQVCPDANADGTPVSRETYNDLVYLPTVDRMFSFDGQKAPCASDSGATWTLDLSVSPPVWHSMDPVNGFNPVSVAANGAGSVTGAICAYDPNTDSVFCSWGNQYGLLQYTYNNNTWKALAPIGTDVVVPNSTAVVDPVRRLLIFIGTLGDGKTLKVNAIDISGADPTYAVQDWTSQLSACSGMAGIWPGMAYDPVLDRIVEWPGTGNTVYLVNTVTKTCVAQTFPGGPQIGPGINNGTFGRFRYFPELNAYVVVNNAELDAQMLRLNTTSLGWAVEGSGYISGSGVLTAGSPGSVATITADVGGVTGTATVTVVPDTTPPSVSITAPSSQSTVSGIVTVTANATDNASVIDVQFQLDGNNLGSPVIGSGPSYRYSWNTAVLFNGAQLVNGPHVLAAIATDTSGKTTVSSPVTVILNSPQALHVALQLHADQTEVSGVANGSVVTPSIAPSGFKGAVVANGTGSVNFTTAETGNGVYFLNCCVNGNNAYYHFTGSTLGNIFNTNQGQIAFYLKSRYSFAQRAASASTPRYAFDVRDGNGNHLFYFLTQVSGGLLFFNYAIAGATQYTSLQPGTEDATFGNGVILKVQMTWSAGVMNLYLNNKLAQSTPYANTAPDWSPSSIFDLGAYEYLTYGGFYGLDDVIDEFTVAGPAIALDTTPPVVTLTAPVNGATVRGTVALTATATDNVAVTGVQYQLDGKNLGGVITGAGPAYSFSWDTTAAANGPHTLAAIASDAAGNTAKSSISVTVSNAIGSPVISAVSAGTPTSSGATITWTTDQASNSQVAYGTISSYGSLSALNSTLVTSHSVTLTGLATSTTYFYKVQSQSAQGGLGTSGGFTFTTAAAAALGSQPLLQMHLDRTEVSGVTNGSVVTPSTAPAGFTGTVVANGTGSVNFTTAETGNGVYFLNCCVNGNNAYYKFTGSTIGNIFNVNQGQITFYLKSRYSFAQRTANASAPRYAFDVRDGAGNHLFYFLTQVSGGLLFFNYGIAGTAQYAYAQPGTEDATFGSGVIMQVQLTWNAGVTNLYLNGILMKSAPYSVPATNWSAASVFDVGAFEYETYGGFYGLDDVIDEFRVTAAPPVISALSAGTVTSSGATITWTTDQASNSQVAYGTTSSYGSLSALNSTPVTSHSVTLTGLAASTTYHYRVQSQSAQGGLGTSGGFTFTTAPGPEPLLQMHLDQTEVSRVTNGSVVTPSIAPAGFTGAVVANGTGSVNFTPAQTGNGVYFLNCCVNANNAYYKFTGSTIGNIFNVNQGQITFYLKSRYSFAQRTANSSGPRYAFDVRDGNGNHLFYFLTQVSGGLLFFNYGIAGTTQYAYAQPGTEDAMFGNGAIMQVQMTWDAGVTNLYLNGVLMKSAPYSVPATNWSAASVFDVGAFEYETYGGFYGLDDVIDEITILPRPQ